jgi:hypothetical protein
MIGVTIARMLNRIIYILLLMLNAPNAKPINVAEEIT